MAFSYLSPAQSSALVEALAPAFLGLEQQALLASCDKLARVVVDDVEIDIQNLYDFRTLIQSTAGASNVGVTDVGGFYPGVTVEAALAQIGTYMTSPVSVAWGSITGTLASQTDLSTTLGLKLNSSLVSAYGLTLIDDANAAAARTTLGLGTAATSDATSFQSSSPTLTSLAGLTTAFALTIMDDTTASAVRTTIGAGTGNGTVASASVVTANGVSGSVATASTTPAITLTLGAITPTSVAASGTVTSVGPLISTGSVSGLFFDNRTGTARGYAWYADANIVRLNVGGVGDVFSITENGSVTLTSGIFTDQYGHVRNIPLTTQNATYTFVLADAGRARRKTDTSAYSYTVNTGVFSGSEAITVVNNGSAGAITIVQGTGVTMRLTGTTTTGSRTVAAYGVATIYMVSSTECFVSGPGVT